MAVRDQHDTVGCTSQPDQEWWSNSRREQAAPATGLIPFLGRQRLASGYITCRISKTERYTDPEYRLKKSYSSHRIAVIDLARTLSIVVVMALHFHNDDIHHRVPSALLTFLSSGLANLGKNG